MEQDGLGPRRNALLLSSIELLTDVSKHVRQGRLMLLCESKKRAANGLAFELRASLLHCKGAFRKRCL